MSFAYWMVLAAALLPYLTVFLAKQACGIDNRAPRRSLEALTGWRKRADWACAIISRLSRFLPSR